jgi:hypothetical protein
VQPIPAGATDPPGGFARTVRIDISDAAQGTVWGRSIRTPRWVPWACVAGAVAEASAGVARWILAPNTFYSGLNEISLIVFLPLWILVALYAFRAAYRPRPTAIEVAPEGIAVEFTDGARIDQPWNDPKLLVGMMEMENKAGRKLATLAGSRWYGRTPGNVVVLPPEAVQPIEASASAAGVRVTPRTMARSALAWHTTRGVVFLGTDVPEPPEPGSSSSAARPPN